MSPMRGPVRGLILAACLAGIPLLLAGCGKSAPSPASKAGYLFCFWNVENLFDDHNDRRSGADREYDPWFARDPVILRKKVDNLADALIRLNDGRGPDILAIVEVESYRAAELLRAALNRRLADPALHYGAPAMKEVSAGRHIAPAILTRLPVVAEETHLVGARFRILETHIQLRDHDLVVVASHWTSRLTDKTGVQRARYADAIFGAYRAMARSNPKVDFLVCGDCNDPPESASVAGHLRGASLAEVMQPSAEPRLLNLLADKAPAQFGTVFHEGKWEIFDEILVAPGLLDAEGWSCDPESVRVVNSLYRPGDRQRKPWRFGGPKEKGARGTSDHFPVTVRLQVSDH